MCMRMAPLWSCSLLKKSFGKSSMAGGVQLRPLNHFQLTSNSDLTTTMSVAFLPLAFLCVTLTSADTFPNITNCTPPSIDLLPSDGLTREQRQHGWIIIHFIVAIYLFGLLAYVCDDYFVPSIKKFCEVLHMREDIAGATLMTMATSSNDLFVNIVGTFFASGSEALGAIVGSSVCNILAIPACCCLFARMSFKLDWWPLTRDSIVYGCSVVVLMVVLRDGRVDLLEAAVMVILYVLYVVLLICSPMISGLWKKRNGCLKFTPEKIRLILDEKSLKTEVILINTEVKKSHTDFQDVSTWKRAYWLAIRPIKLVLFVTVPDIDKFPKLYPITFLMSMIWMAVSVYIVTWAIIVIGDTFLIPDSITGFTFLAIGAALPEIISSVIVANQGMASMGLSNSLGSNTYAVLISLGVPWLIKCAFLPQVQGQHSFEINATGLSYSSAVVLTSLVLLYLCFLINGFKIDWKIGIVCLTLYLSFLILASLIELNQFVLVNLPTCAH